MKNLGKMIKKNMGGLVPNEKQIMKNVLSELKDDVTSLTDEVKRIEPRRFIRSAHEIGKTIVQGTSPKLARTWLKWGIVGYMFNKAYKGDKKASDLGYTVLGQIPGLDAVRGWDLSPRYFDPKYGIVANAVSVAPAIGMIDALIPGRPLTRGIHDKLFPKKEKQKKPKKDKMYR